MAWTQFSCTKSRKAELPDDLQGNILPISIFISPTDSSPYFVSKTEGTAQSEASDLNALHVDSTQRVSATDAQVPSEVKFMFENLPLVSKASRDFKVTFSIDRQHITAYKVVEAGQTLTTFEKNIAVTAREVEIISNLSRSTELNVVSTLVNQLTAQKKQRQEIVSGKRQGSVLVPLFKYSIDSFGVVERAKNELKEDTSVLKLKETEWSSATHIQIRAKSDARQVIGLIPTQVKELSQVFDESKIDKKLMSVSQLAENLNIAIPHLSESATVFTLLDDHYINVYELTQYAKLSAASRKKKDLLKDSDSTMLDCSRKDLALILGPKDTQCVLQLKATIPVNFIRADLNRTDRNGATSADIAISELTKNASVGLVKVQAEIQAGEIKLSFDEQNKWNDIHKLAELNLKKMTSKQLGELLKIAIPNINGDKEILTRLDDQYLHIYEVTEISKLTQAEFIKFNIKKNSSEQIIPCTQGDIFPVIKPVDTQCVVVRRAYIPVDYIRVEVSSRNTNVITAQETNFLSVAKSENSGIVSVKSEMQTSEVKVNIEEDRQLSQFYSVSELDGKKTTAKDLSEKFKVGLKFLNPTTSLFTLLDHNSLFIYEITKLSSLTETQRRLFKNNAALGQIFSCNDAVVPKPLRSNDPDCVMVTVARVPVDFRRVEVILSNSKDLNSDQLIATQVQKNADDAKVFIFENTAAQQLEVTQSLDPDSTIKVSDIQGEFMYRRTFEDASNMFLGRTGTSGDMSIVKFELEDERLVVRNQESLIKYTGQGAKDREEIMSIPVKYYVLQKENANGVPLITPQLVESKKEKAEYIKLDWTQNQVPNASSPLAFFDGGDCFMANTSQKVTDMDMRLSGAGLLNFSISASYTMKPTTQCISVKDVNSAYWAGSFQFNYNVKERISFRKHLDPADDKQFTLNMSHMAQAAFNFGLFTVADRVTEDGILINRDGSEKYMPIVHDFRNNKTITYYLGGLTTAATSPERRQFLYEAAKQVVAEWNATFAISFKGTNLERADIEKNPYITLILDDKNEGRLGDLDRNYVWFNELEAENGLLGVAQPAANPRSGKTMAANVIVYTGNTEDQARRLVKMTSLARAYEKELERFKKEAFEELKKQKESEKQAGSEVITGQAGLTGGADTIGTQKLAGKLIAKSKIQKLTNSLAREILSLGLNQKHVKDLFKSSKIERLGLNQRKPLTKDALRTIGKGEKFDLETNSSTFLKQLVALAIDKKLSQSPRELELAVNNAFIKFGGLDAQTAAKIQTRSEQLAMAVRFDQNNKHRPGCFMYAREDVNDANLVYKKDGEGNEVLDFQESVKQSFRRAVMSTLSHELGHGFGLMHNFKGSTDAENYDFSGTAEKTGRNYSSIMDYMSDAEMAYRGPGPYDAHAIRAGYTGYVELSAAVLANAGNMQAIINSGVKLIDNRLIHINDLMALTATKSFVHLTKDSLNSKGLIKHYNQCDDMGQGETVLCAMFDYGSTATEIVQNKIADYKRSYVLNYYVADKINFNFQQKVSILYRNIANFQGIRSYLDEAVMAIINGVGRPQAESQVIRQDLIAAAKTGYEFFHELIRNPDADNVSAGIEGLSKRVVAVPFEYLGDETKDADKSTCSKNEKSQLICSEVKILETKSLYDFGPTRQKMDTFGVGYDKIFAMQFLLQSSSAPTTDDSQQSMISYLDFEQWFLGVADPADSLTIRTLKDSITGDLKVGFFSPNSQFIEANQSVEVNRMLGEQSAIAAVIGLYESKWKGFDLFAESFKIGRSSVSKAPSDRFNVVKQGQSRKAPDSRVYYSTQNAVGSAAIIKTAARSELLTSNADAIFANMKLMFEADQPANQMLKQLSDKLIEESCVLDESGAPTDLEKCLAAINKPEAEYIKENPELAKLRKNGEKIMFRLLKQLRDLNSTELIMPKAADASDSPTNLAVLTEAIRRIINEQLPFIIESLQMLAQLPPEKIQDGIDAVVEQIQPIAEQNKKIEGVPLVALTHMFITKYAEGLDVELQNKQKLSGGAVAGAMMTATKLKDDHTRYMEVIEKLGFYTGLVDTDTVGN